MLTIEASVRCIFQLTASAFLVKCAPHALGVEQVHAAGAKVQQNRRPPQHVLAGYKKTLLSLQSFVSH
jgi:hypothetical protein